MARKLKVTLVRSPIRRPLSQKETVKGLGLRKLHGSRVLQDTPSIRGMIRKVQHLVKVEAADEIPPESADKIVSKPASNKLSNQKHPGDQHVADHEAGHAAVLDVVIILVRGAGKDCDYDKLSITIDPDEDFFGEVVFNIRNLPKNQIVGRLLIDHCLAGVVADALGELLDKLGRREEGITAEEVQPYIADLLPRMEGLWAECGGTDLKSMNEDTIPKYLPGFVLNLRDDLLRSLEIVRRAWPRVLLISKALLKYRTLTQENYYPAVESMAANPP